ncbi:MAG: family 43 glycosylhydrolase [Verrucomicrobiia bacterium]
MKYFYHIVCLVTGVAFFDLSGIDYTNVSSFVSKKVMMFGDTSRLNRPFAKDPAVVRFKNQYLLYYSIPPGRNIQGWRIGIARSDRLVVWEKIGEIDATQECEKNGICALGAIVLGNRVHIFYQTYGNGRNDAICYAWSEDGVNFIKNPSNPVFRPSGDWNCGRAIDADIVRCSDRLFLYFATRDPSFKIQMLGVATADVNSDFSRDCWKQLCNKPILKPELDWERNCIEAPAVIYRDGRFFMFYAGGYNNEPQQIGVAPSDDGVNFKRLSDKPFLPAGKPNNWNASESGHPFIFADSDGKTYLFYQGNNDRGKTWYLSFVQVTWQEDLPRLLTD